MAGFKSKFKRATSTEKQSVESQLKGNKQTSSKFSFSNSSLRALNPLKSLGARLFLIIIVAMLICVIFVGVTSIIQAEKLLEKNLTQASEETVKQVARNIETTLTNYEETAIQLMVDENLIKEMRAYLSTTETYEMLTAVRNVNSSLSTILLSNSQIRNIGLIPASSDQKAIIVGSLSNSTNSQKTISEFQSEEWFKQTIANKGTATWINPQANGIIDSSAYKNVAIARLVSGNSDSQSYIIVLEFIIDELFDAAADVNLVENSYITIVDEQNNYVLAHDNSLVGQPAVLNIPVENLQETEAVLTTTNTAGESYLTIHRQLKNNSNWNIVSAIPTKSIEKQTSGIKTVTTIALIGAIVVSVFVGILVMLIVSRPLAIISSIMRKGAKGDLTVRSPHMNRQDEIGMLSRNFDEMMINIEKLAQQTTNSANDVLKTATELTSASQKTAVSAKEIAIATDEIASGASSLAVEAEKGADLTSQINMQMEQVNTYNEQMKLSASEVENASMQGTSYMSELMDKTGLAEQRISSMVEKINALSTSTSSIVKILDVMNNVTKQTNILSLNATIEAARAGAAGKGFMVVADEIRQLAEQSKQSIEVVGKITDTITQEIKDTVQVLSEAQPIFQEQIHSVKEANQLFISVQTQMEHLKQNMDLVTDSFGILNASQAVLSQAMNNVSAVAEESSATSEEVASLSTEQLTISDQLVELSSELENVSTQLQSQLQKFKIG